jgi:hypothetical protein
VHIDVPGETTYGQLIDEQCASLELPMECGHQILAIALATTRKMGPAVALDTLRHVAGLRDLAADGFDWKDSLVSALSAYVVPQFEGSSLGDASGLLAAARKIGASAERLGNFARHLSLVTGHDL